MTARNVFTRVTTLASVITLLLALFIRLPGARPERARVTPAPDKSLKTDGPRTNVPAPTALSLDGGARIRTDRGVYPKPPLPRLPRAGGKFTDPVFGSEIMRATDEADGPAPGLGTYYSHWPTFNSDSTKLLIRKGVTGEAIVKGFDPINFRLTKAAETLPNALPGGGGPNWESSIWSTRDPSIIYTFSGYFYGGMKLYTYSLRTKSFKLIKDLSSLGGEKDYLRQMYMSEDEDTFCWLQLRAGENNGQPVAFIVYRRSTDKVLYHEDATKYQGGVNEVHVDKSGRWLHVVVPTKQADGTGTRFLNLQTGKYQALVKEVDHPPGHGDLGTGTIVGFDNYEGGISLRHLEDARRHTMVLRFQNERGVTDWTNDFHGSMLAEDESWITIGTYDQPEANSLPDSHIFEDEIMQVSLDGSQRFKRLCHTRTFIDNKTQTTGYWAMPKPTVSRDGRYIAFTSNWENSGRYDLFILKVEPDTKKRVSR